jgi:hypothetical protein
MEEYNAKLNEFAAMCGVSVTDAALFVALVNEGLRQGMDVEAAIERGRRVIVQVLDNIRRNPIAARQFVANLYDDLRAKAVA